VSGCQALSRVGTDVSLAAFAIKEVIKKSALSDLGAGRFQSPLRPEG